MSGGEAQRLALARVLLADHDVVVLDEPTANLDATTAARVLDTVLDRCDERTTILLGHVG
jgi:ABC-type transport system involved in cytochrome bd biosynthesis fused ATPase/permease subunit